MTIKLSRRARRDLDEIRRYAIETWNRIQWLTYYRGLAQALERIAADPDIGRDRSLFAPGLRSVNYKQHVIFFGKISAAGNEPVVLRIVHRRRNLPALVYYEDVAG